ncbi:MAG: RHS repeat-associated core domain-containing protein [Pseudomonas sp.]
MTTNNTNSPLFFYQGAKPILLKYGEHARRLFSLSSFALAELHSNAVEPVELLTTDDKGSVLQTQKTQARRLHGYTVYGYSPVESSRLHLLGFNGELRQPETGWYLLGNGYRTYNPTIMRFLSPDSLSPFNLGGLNSYVYVTDDPVNYSDPDGHFRLFSRSRTFSGSAKLVTENYVYMAKHPTLKGEQAITIATHGNTGLLSSAGGKVSAKAFVNGVKKAGFNTEKHDIHVIACNSANVDANNQYSFIQQVSNLTDRRVFGYKDKVFVGTHINLKRSGSGKIGVAFRVFEKESFFSKTSEFNFQRREANPQKLIRDPDSPANRI